MKKIWILTPLLLGVAMVGCSGQPGNVASDGLRQESAEETRVEAPVSELSTVDESLTQRPLEEHEPVAETDMFLAPEASSKDLMDLQRNGQQQQQGISASSGPAATQSTPFGVPESNSSGAYGGDGSAMDGIGMGMEGYSSQPGDHPFSGEAEEAGKAVRSSRMKQLPKLNKKVDSNRALDVAEAKKEAPAAPGVGGMVAPAPQEPAARVASNPVPATKPAERYRRGGEMQDGEFEALDEMIVELDKPGEGTGPGEGGDKFEPIEENDFIAVADQPLSTFSIDVDTASYSKIRSYLSQFGQLPPRDAVRVEELVNYFTYDYATPTDEHPFAANVEVASCPWNPTNRLVRVGIKGKEVDTEDRPASNLVFLLDVSGSMNNANKLPLLKKGMKMLVDQLGENDKVSIVVYAGAAGMVLEPTYGYEKAKILAALDRLQAGGSTNGGQGIQLAYKTATENFIQGGTNRVILCTDGDFNVGETSTGGLVGMAAQQAKKNIYMSVMGFGIGNHNDSMLEQLSNKANGNYSFIDNEKEAKKVLVEQMSGTLLTIAKDVKIQIEFNPKKVASYRLVGYENRLLAAQDFNDDKKDAGEIGAGHTVTAFYEVTPATGDGETEVAAVDPKVDELKYQTKPETTEAADSNELMTLKLRYKQPEEDVSTLMTYPVVDNGNKFNQATGDFQFASAVAMFGLKLRGSHFHQETNFAEIEELVASNVDGPGSSYREEFLDMVRQVERIKK